MGYGWSHLTPDYDWGEAGEINNGNCNLVIAFPTKAGKDITVKDNVFYLSTYALVGGKNYGQEDEYPVSFSGNTYVQHNMGMLAEWPMKDDYSYQDTIYYNIGAKEAISELLGDKTPKILSPNNPQ